jgi:hypothetical protein
VSGIINKEVDVNKEFERISSELKGAGFDHALAIATEAEVEAGAACGQLSIITGPDQGE